MHRLVIALVALVAGHSAPAHAQKWDCYGPEPGHPTLEERKVFVAKVSKEAIKAEKNYGVPAGPIAAMAIVESGYGFTRTAKSAQNYFGWKYFSAKSADGRNAFTLECQPEEDVGNQYIIFRDLADSVDFVARKLATLSYYAGDTKNYREKLKTDAGRREAVIAWVADISDPYNWRPEEYLATITRVMNDPVSPSDTAGANSLYFLSDPVIISKQPSPLVGDSSYEYAIGKIQTWAGKCESPIRNYARWKGFPVQRCEWKDIGITVSTYMLNPSKGQMAAWVTTACREVGATKMNSCIDILIDEIKNASSMGVFPIAGFLPESHGGNRCYLFRDGVTVYTKGYPAAQIGSCPAGDFHFEPVLRAKKFARIASTTREEYRAAGGSREVGKVDDVRWLDAVREAYQAAWTSPRNLLIVAKAKSLKREGKII
jgi:hypothetical protein